ncbi:hypothetical protein [Nonomuraea basaltis]|uniref:hypothetical protein n=1 Tax=Nonomuraea basaltis TaxID=2495887 RepID=UPI00110C628C|nr:hypothetical protein [Nonomuraea basaltis]TMR90102.1 hypothetical protein EJK15_57195 [Nonomuraea basaltis]
MLRIAVERVFRYASSATAPDRKCLMNLDGVEIPDGAVASPCATRCRSCATSEHGCGSGWRTGFHFEVFGPDLWLSASW